MYYFHRKTLEHKRFFVSLPKISEMRIKEVIKEKGLTVKEVAERMGITSPALSRAINNNTTVEMLYRIADAIGVHPTELFEQPEIDTVSCPYCGGKIRVGKD